MEIWVEKRIDMIIRWRFGLKKRIDLYDCWMEIWVEKYAPRADCTVLAFGVLFVYSPGHGIPAAVPSCW